MIMVVVFISSLRWRPVADRLELGFNSSSQDRGLAVRRRWHTFGPKGGCQRSLAKLEVFIMGPRPSRVCHRSMPLFLHE